MCVWWHIERRDKVYGMNAYISQMRSSAIPVDCAYVIKQASVLKVKSRSSLSTGDGYACGPQDVA